MYCVTEVQVSGGTGWADLLREWNRQYREGHGQTCIQNMHAQARVLVHMNITYTTYKSYTVEHEYIMTVTNDKNIYK